VQVGAEVDQQKVNAAVARSHRGPALNVASVAILQQELPDGPTLARSSTAMSIATIFCFYREVKAGLNRGQR
jgi:hypothetical protein